MGRIRSIKPEFPQSESMGRVSREARLCFLLLWTLADDEGRLRGNSRMLARLLYPYDDGEGGHQKTSGADIDLWLAELESEDCIGQYLIDGTHYIQITKWLIHQKIDRPSKSKIPPIEDGSRILANPREHSTADQGSRIKDQGKEGIKIHLSEQSPDAEKKIVVLSKQKKRRRKEELDTSNENYRCAQYCFGLVLRINQSASEPNWNTWTNHVRLMVERDSRTHREICEMFKFANHHHFWCKNILSPESLRKQWDRLMVEKLNPSAKNSTVAADARMQQVIEDNQNWEPPA